MGFSSYVFAQDVRYYAGTLDFVSDDGKQVYSKVLGVVKVTSSVSEHVEDILTGSSDEKLPAWEQSFRFFEISVDGFHISESQ